MDNYLDIINMIDYAINYDVYFAYFWIHPEYLPKMLIKLGEYDSGFYKMPEYYINYKYISGTNLNPPVRVPIIKFSEDLFKDNNDITDLILSRFITNLPNEAFMNMKKLKRIWIPKGIKYIPKDCFRGCNIEEIYYEGNELEYKEINVYYKQFKVIPRLGIKDEIEEYYDLGNISFINAKVYYNQVRNEILGIDGIKTISYSR